MKVHDALIDILVAEEIDTVFSLMSEGIMLFTSKMRDGDRINVVETRHEQNAVAMADGFARATSNIGVAVIGRGPAIAQTGTALRTAHVNGTELLVIVSQSPRSTVNGLKDFPQDAFLESVMDNVFSIRDEGTVVSTFVDAFRLLATGHGPVVVQVPWDILDGEAEHTQNWEESSIGKTQPVASSSRRHPDGASVDETIDRYLESDASVPPFILVGRGAVRAGAKEAIERLAELTGGLIGTTVRAQGYFSDHPFSVGFVGTLGANIANSELSESDFVLAVGCSLNDHTTDSGRLLDEATVVHVEADPRHIDRHMQVDQGVIGDARITVETLIERLERNSIDFSEKFWTEARRRRIADSPRFDDREFPELPGTIDQRDLVGRLDSMLPSDRLVITDGGAFLTWVLDGITISNPEDFVWTVDFVTLGLGHPMGIGAAHPETDRTPIIFCGDAGFQMSIQELNTAVREGVSMIVVILNDNALGAEYHKLGDLGGNPDASLLESPSFASIAEAYGATGYTIRSVADLEKVEEAIASRPDGPVVLDCKINREVRHRSYD